MEEYGNLLISMKKYTKDDNIPIDARKTFLRAIEFFSLFYIDSEI